MQRWEYQLVKLQPEGFFATGLNYETLADTLNHLGAEGWEVVSMADTNYSRGATRALGIILKRPVRSCGTMVELSKKAPALPGPFFDANRAAQTGVSPVQ